MTHLGYTRRVVRSGLIDQRDRATKRRRRKPAPDHDTTHLYDQLHGLARKFVDQTEPYDFVSCDDFLDFVAMPTVAIAERLRLLAIVLEESGYPWKIVEEVYALARRHDPDDYVVLESLAISAQRLSYTPRAVEVAYQSALEGAFRWPEDPQWEYRLGRHLYEHMQDAATALGHFDRAIELGSRDGLTLLYRARSLQDLGRWEEALAAYDDVPLAQFDKPWLSWRVHFLVEERATCLYFAGHRDASRNQFMRIIDRYEKQPALATHGECGAFLTLAADRFPDLAGRIADVLTTTQEAAWASVGLHAAEEVSELVEQFL